MKRDVRQIVAVVSLGAVAALLYACGGGSDGGGFIPVNTDTNSSAGPAALPYKGVTKQAAITPETVAGVATNLAGPNAGYVPICTASSSAGKITIAKNQSALSAAKALNLVTQLGGNKSLAMISVNTFAPADKPGTCGGFLRYKSWNHASGSTSGTLSYDNYCYTVLTTDDKTTINGDVPFSASGTPGDFGPVLSKVTASTPSPLTIQIRTAANEPKVSAKLAFDKLEIIPGSPGTSGSTTNNTNPDSYKVASVLIQNGADSTKQYMAQNVTITMVKTTGGGTIETITGRLHDSTFGYLDVTTSNPIVIDSAGIHQSGSLTVSGSNSPLVKANIKIVPSDPHSPAFTVDINGIDTGALVDCYNPWTINK